MSSMLMLVAPLAGAWIEMQNLVQALLSCQSLPSRERGLKFCDQMVYILKEESLPSRERGLK